MKQKILYIITQGEFGGAQRYIFDLATNLNNPPAPPFDEGGGKNNNGFEIVVAVGEAKGSDELPKRLTAAGIRVVRLKHLIREINLWHDLQAVCEIRELLKKEKPDIVHLNSTKAGFVGSLATLFTPPHLPLVRGGKFRKPRLIYTIHGWIFLEPLSAWRKKLYLALEKISGRICDALVVLSQSELQTGLNKKICKADKLHLIPHGIKLPDFLSKEVARETLLQNPPQSSPLSLARVASVKGGGLVVGTIANFYPTKGLPYLVEAVAKLKSKNHPAQCVIVGDGLERPYLESLIVKYNLEEDIILAGQIPEAAKYLKAFDIFVLPSVKEGLPYALMEAMAAGLPIVATEVGGVPEMITNNQDGLLVPPKNPEALAAVIEKLIDNPDLRKTLGENARAAAGAKFNLEKMLEKTKKIYQLL